MAASFSKRLSGPVSLSTSAQTVYTSAADTVVTRGRVSNPTGSTQTFTMSIGVDAAGTRIYSATPILAGRALDIYGPLSLADSEIIQAFGSSSSLVLELNGLSSVGGLPTLSVSSSGRYLQAGGVPYRLQSEFLWQAWLTLTLSEFITYLDDRQARGFNAFECWLIDINSHGAGVVTPNSRGDLPFTSGTDLSTPNAAYFDYVDLFLDAAEVRGFRPLMYPSYTGYLGADWWTVFAANSLANCQGWGTYVGNRYKNRRSMFLMLGGDYNQPNDSTRTKEVAFWNNIRAAGCLQLVGSEWGDPDTLITDQAGYTYGPDPSVSLGNLGAFYGEGPKEGGAVGNGLVYDTADRAWRDATVIPPFACEMPQTDGTYYPLDMSRASTRKYTHWAVTSGSVSGSNCGQTNVANPTSAANLFAHYQDPYIFDQQYGNALYSSLKFWLMRPSGTTTQSPQSRSGATGYFDYCGRVLIVSGGGSANTLITSCMSSDGDQLLAYVPPDLPVSTTTKTFSVDCRSLSAGSKPARWWNPTTGAFTTASPSTVNNSLAAQSFTTPGDNGTGTNDWMLVVG